MVVPRGPVDLLALPAARPPDARTNDLGRELRYVHEETSARLCTANAGYKCHVDARRRPLGFEVGNFVWSVLTKDFFSRSRV